jgi:hypothetical protein
VILGGQTWTADNDLGLSCRWARGVITFEEVKLDVDEDSLTELEREIFELDSDYHSL